ncbi:unnamed protein product [Triticum turgidum subsp. durum]|uniref:Thioredoxin domain-containing protein n=1 Tax=Triticum turgidum subsp. durum TaxID=4567 RepID=A0A9R0VSQ3_TRITD|nr:unnamed protein product [Triticum turgidum subsp. durum]
MLLPLLLDNRTVLRACAVVDDSKEVETRSETDRLVDGLNFGELCNDFECISSPYVESTARQIARDILEIRQDNRALSCYAVAVKYKVAPEQDIRSRGTMDLGNGVHVTVLSLAICPPKTHFGSILVKRAIEGETTSLCQASPKRFHKITQRELEVESFLEVMLHKKNRYIHKDPLRSFVGREKYKRPLWITEALEKPIVTVQEMSMQSTSSLTIKWTLRGKPKNAFFAAAGGELVVRVDSQFILNQISGQVLEHFESWDLSASSPLAQAYFWFSRRVYSTVEAGKDTIEAAKGLASRLNKDDNIEVYPDPLGDPTKFFTRPDDLNQDVVQIGLFLAVLYFIVTEVCKDTFWPIVKAAGEKPVVLDMYTQWCGPCKVMAPKFQEMSEKDHDVVFLKLDCNQDNRPLAKELGIRVVPTFKIFKDGKVAKEVTGAKIDELARAIEEVKSS